MDTETAAKSVGDKTILPLPLSDIQEVLCERLDDFHTLAGLQTKASDMFRGAVFVSRSDMRNNADWLAQAAHSLRDILYPLGKKKQQTLALTQYGSIHSSDASYTDRIGRLLGKLTELAHHNNCQGSSVDYHKFTAEEFIVLLGEFESTMMDALSRQTDVRAELMGVIEEAVTSDVSEEIEAQEAV